jgi:hypothetical protein
VLRREKYIEEKMHSKRAEETGDAGRPTVSEEDALFALPDHLNPRKQQAAAPEDDESASGGVLIWNTGIAEVELPETFAARATQRALQQQEASRAARARGANVDSSALPANFSTDFNRHRSDFVAELKTMRKGASLSLSLSSLCMHITLLVGGGRSHERVAVRRRAERAWLPQRCRLHCMTRDDGGDDHSRH